jgi:LacI family transcriptional regulator
VSGKPRMPQSARVRLADVAELARVGPSIVSRVLNKDPSLVIRPETRERILHAVDQLGYRPNAFARGLKISRTMTLGMVVPNLAYPVNAEILRGAERAAAAAGYVVLLADADEFVEAGEAYKRLVVERRVDGLLVASASVSDPFLANLAGRDQPVVLVNRRGPSSLSSVTVDDAEGVRLAVAHLMGLGHQRIAHMAGPSDVDTARRRLAGFVSGVAASSYELSPEYVVEASFDEEGGWHAMFRLLELDEPPTAVIVASMSASIGALAAAADRGVTVPRDLSLIGFHDVPLAAYLHPPLTTVRMPLRELGEIGVQTLLGLIDAGWAGDGDERTTADVMIPTPPRLVHRRSTAPPPR